MIRTLQKHGNSHALVIEKALMDQLGIDACTPVQLTVTGRTLTITPVNVGLGHERVKELMGQVRARYGRALKDLAR
jgi:antitoxin component of MazEF toxin-antitoxin module